MSKKTETNIIPEQKENQSKGVRILKTIFNVIINILIVIILLTSILVATLSLTSKADPNGLPNIFGYTFQYVQTNSMAVEPPAGFEGGNFTDKDVIICRVYSSEEFPEINVGDIVTYRSDLKDENGNAMMITHRVVDKQERDGSTVYQTKGDAEDIPDQSSVEEYIGTDRFVSVNYNEKYQGKTLNGFADFFRTLRSPGGFFGIILIPMIAFFIYAIIRVVLSAMNYKKGKEDEVEKEKQEAVDAAVAAALAEKDKKPEEASADMTPEQMEQFKQFLAFQQAQKAQQSAAEPAAEETPVDTTEE